jgi:hypothetical protein
MSVGNQRRRARRHVANNRNKNRQVLNLDAHSMPEIGQFLIELFLQFFFEVFADAVWRQFPEPARHVIKGTLFVLLSTLMAWVSTVFLPTSLIAPMELRILYLILGPMMIGLAMAWIGRWFEKSEKTRSGLETFSFGWLFAFTFALTRFLLIP